MNNKTFDTIVALAVIEHLPVAEVYAIFDTFKTKLRPQGLIFLTTPSPLAKPVLECMAAINLLDKANIAEHKHYWTKKEIFELGKKTGYSVLKYKKIQIGFNQLAIFEHSK